MIKEHDIAKVSDPERRELYDLLGLMAKYTARAKQAVEQPREFASQDTQKLKALTNTVRILLTDMPMKRDWLNPDLEKTLKELVGWGRN